MVSPTPAGAEDDQENRAENNEAQLFPWRLHGPAPADCPGQENGDGDA